MIFNFGAREAALPAGVPPGHWTMELDSAARDGWDRARSFHERSLPGTPLRYRVNHLSRSGAKRETSAIHTILARTRLFP